MKILKLFIKLTLILSPLKISFADISNNVEEVKKLIALDSKFPEDLKYLSPSMVSF